VSAPLSDWDSLAHGCDPSNKPLGIRTDSLTGWKVDSGELRILPCAALGISAVSAYVRVYWKRKTGSRVRWPRWL